MPKNAKREITFMILIALVPWPILHFAFYKETSFGLDNMIWAMSILSGLTLLLWFVGHRRRQSSTVNASMDSERRIIQVWMKRPSKAWGDKLSIASNTLILDDIEGASTTIVNGNRTLVLKANGRSSAFHLPQRLAVQPEVKDFFEDYLATDEGSKTTGKLLITKFVNGDEGIVEKDKTAPKKPATLSELLEQEKETLEKEKAELEAQILGAEKEEGSQ